MDCVVAVVIALLCSHLSTADVAWHKPNHNGRGASPFTIPPYSLNSACASETRELCEVRTPFGDNAIQCFESHRADLSPQCAEWHDARMQCKTQIESSQMHSCPECAAFCGKGRSLMHCIRAAGSRIGSIVNAQCTDTDFFRSLNRHYKRKHFAEPR
jgi:hypothetical protein